MDVAHVHKSKFRFARCCDKQDISHFCFDLLSINFCNNVSISKVDKCSLFIEHGT